jgi:Xaa-Pro aminopeptidase
MKNNICRILSALVVFSFTITLSAQDDLPTDYLSKEFHAGRREALRKLMPDNSVFIVMSFPTRTFSNDVEYFYHQNPDMYYFSGYKEPHSLLIIFKEEQKGTDGSSYKEIIYVQKKDARAEQWTGRRLGTEGVKEKLGFSYAYNGEDFKNAQIDFTKFDKIIFDRFPEDAGIGNRSKSELADFIELFKIKANITAENSKDSKYDTRLYRELTGKLREIKTPEEMDLLRKAVEISCRGQNEVMKSVHPGMSELEIQGLHEYIHKKYGAEEVGYGSIIGAGANGCILHYMENTKTKVGNDLLLMDVGAEYHGYTADVTRTVPANGKFSAEQKIIYNLVYDAQEAAFKTLKEGSRWSDAETAARDVIVKGLIKLGIAKNENEANSYYPHGLGHHIGLDVHDRSYYTPNWTLKKNMVMTIEPGIYIPPNSKCDKKWWSISVRIEDDALITEKGYELLSVFSPRRVEDIEKMIAEKSALDNFTVPKLKSAEKKAF